MADEEEEARTLLERAEAIAGAYGVGPAHGVRTRDASEGILEQLGSETFEMVVIGARRREHMGRRGPAFDHPVHQVLRRASCRVLIVASPLAGAERRLRRAWRGSTAATRPGLDTRFERLPSASAL